MWRDMAIPILPAIDAGVTTAFYERLGFFVGFEQTDPELYLILARGELELQFFLLEGLDPATSYAGCYLRVTDVEGLYREFVAAGLPQSGIPRIELLAIQPWGMLEFSVVDPAGNRLRIGQPIDPRMMA